MVKLSQILGELVTFFWRSDHFFLMNQFWGGTKLNVKSEKKSDSDRLKPFCKVSFETYIPQNPDEGFHILRNSFRDPNLHLITVKDGDNCDIKWDTSFSETNPIFLPKQCNVKVFIFQIFD